MFFIKAFSILLLCSFAATEMITFKPFIKSRYSLRTRTRTTPKVNLLKANETAINQNSELNSQHSSTPYSIPLWETTKMASIDKNLQESNNQNSEHSNSVTTTRPVLPTLTIDTTPVSELVNVAKIVTEQSSVTEKPNTKVRTTVNPITTMQTEWVYDYYASDDESPKKK